MFFLFEKLKRAKPVWFCAVLFFFLVSLDFWSRNYFFSHNFSLSNSNYFGLVNFKNYNFAFSLPVPVFFMYAIYGFVLIFILNIFLKDFQKLSNLQRLAWVFILSGAFANISERIVLGYVRDFLFIFSGIFNFADIYILSGIVFLFLVPERSK